MPKELRWNLEKDGEGGAGQRRAFGGQVHRIGLLSRRKDLPEGLRLPAHEIAPFCVSAKIFRATRS